MGLMDFTVLTIAEPSPAARGADAKINPSEWIAGQVGVAEDDVARAWSISLGRHRYRRIREGQRRWAAVSLVELDGRSAARPPDDGGESIQRLRLSPHRGPGAAFVRQHHPRAMLRKVFEHAVHRPAAA